MPSWQGRVQGLGIRLKVLDGFGGFGGPGLYLE